METQTLLNCSEEIIDVVSRRLSLQVSEQSFLESLGRASSKNGKRFDFESYQPLSVEKEILSEALETLSAEALKEAERKLSFHIVARRSIDVEPLATGKNVTINAVVALYPSPIIKDYKSFNLNYPKLQEIGEAEVNEAIELLQHGKFSNFLGDIKGSGVIDDDFAKSLNIPEIGNLEELKFWIKTHLTQASQMEYAANLQSTILEEVLLRNYFEVPIELVDDELRLMLLENGVISSGARDIKTFSVDPYREKYGREALKRVRSQILLDRIVIQESLYATEEDLEKAEMQGLKKDLMDSILDIQRGKALDLLLNRINTN